MFKIIKWKEVNKYRKNWQDKKSVLIGGCFDIFHYGHLRFIKQAKNQGEVLIISLESDKFIKKNKKRSPVHNQTQRAELLSALAVVDYVVLIPFFSSDKDYFRLVQAIRPTVIAVSENDPQYDNKDKQAKKVNANLKVVTRLLKDFSSKKLVRILKSGVDY